MSGFMDSTHGEASAPTDKRQRRMEIDVERYQALLDSADLTPAQKREVIRALWTIIAVAIDLGLGVYPAQAVLAERTSTAP
jgi:hypothetical protein